MLYFLNTSKPPPYTQSTMQLMLDPSNSAFIFILFIPNFCPSSLSLFSSTFYFIDLALDISSKYCFHFIQHLCELLLEWSLSSYHFTFPRLHSLVLLPGKSHGWRSLVGYSPWGREESDTTERLHFHFSLSWTGEGNGNPLQYSCLENPRDGGLVGCHLRGRTESDTIDVT